MGLWVQATWNEKNEKISTIVCIEKNVVCNKGITKIPNFYIKFMSVIYAYQKYGNPHDWAWKTKHPSYYPWCRISNSLQHKFHMHPTACFWQVNNLPVNSWHKKIWGPKFKTHLNKKILGHSYLCWVTMQASFCKLFNLLAVIFVWILTLLLWILNNWVSFKTSPSLIIPSFSLVFMCQSDWTLSHVYNTHPNCTLQSLDFRPTPNKA